MTDCTESIVAAVKQAGDTNSPLYITAGGTKRDLAGRDCSARPLDVAGHRGIVDYQPAELVLTARAGTPLVEVVEILAQQQQMLAFEPPLFDGKATLGGTLACNLSGPARPWSGSIRDMVLGVQLINGKADVLNFGGRVMKNVAGYDVSRLQAGAQGTLGIISEISLKVMPQPEHCITLVYEMSAAQALATMHQRAAESRPLNAAFWAAGQLYLRVAGAASAVSHTAILWGGEQVSQADTLWAQLREMSLPFFAGDAPLWRLSLGSTAPLATHVGDTLIDWGGAQRWLRGEQDLAALQTSAAGGHASLVRGGDRSGELRAQPGRAEQRLQQRLKHSFDPLGIINPGRLYSWL